MIEYVYTLSIDGMKCGMCESHINSVIRNNLKIKSVKSNRHKKETIIISNSPISMDLIRNIMDPTGYILNDIKEERKEKQSIFKGLFKKK